MKKGERGERNKCHVMMMMMTMAMEWQQLMNGLQQQPSQSHKFKGHEREERRKRQQQWAKEKRERWWSPQLALLATSPSIQDKRSGCDKHHTHTFPLVSMMLMLPLFQLAEHSIQRGREGTHLTSCFIRVKVRELKTLSSFSFSFTHTTLLNISDLISAAVFPPHL